MFLILYCVSMIANNKSTVCIFFSTRRNFDEASDLMVFHVTKGLSPDYIPIIAILGRYLLVYFHDIISNNELYVFNCLPPVFVFDTKARLNALSSSTPATFTRLPLVLVYCMNISLGCNPIKTSGRTPKKCQLFHYIIY